jgi:hypothetical protein
MALSTACRLAALAFLATAGARTLLIETKGEAKEATQFANMKASGADYMDSKEATQFANMKGSGADYMANWVCKVTCKSCKACKVCKACKGCKVSYACKACKSCKEA